MNSILNSIKKMLGIDPEYTEFDQELIIHINSIFSVLCQMGVGPKEEFYISDSTDVWDDFKAGYEVMNTVKTFVYLRVRQLFDPPQSSSAQQANDAVIKEFEYRLYTHAGQF